MKSNYTRRQFLQRTAATAGDAGLERPEVAPAVEDDRKVAAQRQAADPHRDRGQA